MNHITEYIAEAKFEDWEKEFYAYRKENGFKGKIEDLYSDPDGFSSEMAMDFYQMYLADKKEKSELAKYNKEIKKMSDKDKALGTSCVKKTAEEIAWLVASAIESALPVETEKHEIPFTKGLSKTTYKVNFNGKDIFFHDKCYELAYGRKGYSTAPGFTIICNDKCKYEYDNRIACEEDTRKQYKGSGKYRTFLYRDPSIKHLIEIIEERVDRLIKKGF